MNRENWSKQINRRSTLMLIGAAVPILALSSTSAKASQMSQKTAHYIAKSTNGKLCSGCKFFEAPHACKIVEGDIAPNGWCMLWQKS
jgi:hypothetical protein